MCPSPVLPLKQIRRTCNHQGLKGPLQGLYHQGLAALQANAQDSYQERGLPH